MKTRNYYLYGALGLLVLMMYLFTSQNRVIDQQEHIKDATADREFVLAKDSVVFLENDKLEIVVDVATGNILEARLKKYLVENIEGSFGVRVFGSDPLTNFKYYLRTGFVGTDGLSNYSLSSKHNDGVVLINKEGYEKHISFINDGYELEIKDVKPGPSTSSAYAALYRTKQRALDIKTDFLAGGMMNNASFEGVGFSNEVTPYEAKRLKILLLVLFQILNPLCLSAIINPTKAFLRKLFLLVRSIVVNLLFLIGCSVLSGLLFQTSREQLVTL